MHCNATEIENVKKLVGLSYRPRRSLDIWNKFFRNVQDLSQLRISFEMILRVSYFRTIWASNAFCFVGIFSNLQFYCCF